MKLIVQFGVVSLICWVSLCIEKLLPFAMPASIIGMVLLLILLCLKWVHVAWIRELSDFLLGNLLFFFVPVVVSIVKYLDVLRANWAAMAVIVLVSTVVTFAATAFAVQLTMRVMERRKRK